MKLHDRCAVEGTVPTVYIGHKEYTNSNTGRRKICRRWHAEFNLHGKKHARALGTANKAAAIRAAFKFVEEVQTGDTAIFRKKSTDWQEMRTTYVTILSQKGRAPTTLRKYSQVLGDFVAFVQKRSISTPQSLRTPDFWAFAECLRNEGLAETTIYDRLVIVKQWFKWARKSQLLALDPIAGEEIRDVPSSRQPCFTSQQVSVLLKTADAHYEGPVFTAMAYCGLRFGEAKELRWEDISFENGGTVTIRDGGSNKLTKGRRVRRIPLHPRLRAVLESLPRSTSGRVFTPRPTQKYPNRDRPISERRLLRSLKRLCRRCGFDKPDQYKLHTFRHSFASMLAANQVSYKYALEFMGQRSSEILDIYFTQFDDVARAAIHSLKY